MAGFEWLILYFGSVALAFAFIGGYSLRRFWDWLRGKDKDE
jgi:hypothetical protein